MNGNGLAMNRIADQNNQVELASPYRSMLDTKLAELINNLALKGRRVLDVGCADGSYRRFFNGAWYLGIDLCPFPTQQGNFIVADCIRDCRWLPTALILCFAT